MSSVASTSSAVASRPPIKPVRYLTDDSSYSSFTATSSIRREAEEQAARELAAERQASRQRVLSVWESLGQRYSRALDDDDIVDLESLTLVQDAGTLKQIANVPFGSLAAQNDVGSENDEDEDEIGDWDDERYSAEHAWNRLQTGGGRPPRTEEDEQDLREFLRAEKVRRRDEGLSDDEEDEEADYSHTERETEGRDEDETDVQYVSENQEETQEEEDGESVSSFRPTPSQDRETTTASSRSGTNDTESASSEDELAGPPTVKAKDPNAHRAGAAKALQEVDTDSESEASSSEDEIAASDVEKERRYQERLRTEEPEGRGRLYSVKPSDSPSKQKLAVRTSGNPQLSTPPRSKSFSTPSDVFYQNPSPRQKTLAVRSQAARSIHDTVTARTNRQPSTVPASRTRNPVAPPPLPGVALGKRKRGSSPLPIPSSDPFPPSRSRGHGYSHSKTRQPSHQPRYSHARTYSSSNYTEPPLSIDDYEHEDYESPDDVDSLTRRSPSPVPHRTTGASRHVTSTTGRESLAPSDLSQLVFHLKKVNDWVKTHAGDELPFEDALPIPSFPPQRSPSKRPTWPSSVSNLATENNKRSQQAQATPPNRNRITSVRDSGGSSSARSNRTYSSLMGPPPTPSRLFESSGSAHTSAQTTPNKSSPFKSSPQKGSSSNMQVSRSVTSRAMLPLRTSSSQPARKQVHRHAVDFSDRDADGRHHGSVQPASRTQAVSPTKRRRHDPSPTRSRSSKPAVSNGGALGPNRVSSSVGSRRY